MPVLALCLTSIALVAAKETKQKEGEKSPEAAPEFVANIKVDKDQLPMFRGVKPVRMAPPKYPKEFQRNPQLDARVEVGAVVETTGKVSSAFVVKTNAPRPYQREAMTAIKRWVFEQMVVDGTPIRFAAVVPLTFGVSE